MLLANCLIKVPFWKNRNYVCWTKISNMKPLLSFLIFLGILSAYSVHAQYFERTFRTISITVQPNSGKPTVEIYYLLY